ncbi:ABC transporter [Geoanaerobacter pelophilus]|uniref:ABC transporter n=1 Tax=Geoanaerobacter pelophilus TaxID=60036 RepID=A0ABQ0MHV5_9BACT|nr:ABC transporter ATP-binding protein [Geoanaerobacter pelophilus]GAW66662.1 ABC transporter [Geoanaerobacter pelophilus]
MTMPAICVENLGKKYLISHRQREQYQALRDVITGGFSSAYRRLVKGAVPAPREEEFWALSGVSFDVKQGERVGIIGRNGAGKSTLLKVLSRITEPTAGSVRIRGRVASLLEVGTGFHPELTGRENIFLNGAILGMQRAEIKRKFDEIVDFAEIERFLDTPVKRYSSGMYVRLAFAVAAHLEPEILVVDEVLAVGDAQFQKKCLGKMEAVGQEGRTVIFVSHNMTAVQRLCRKAVWLEDGRVCRQGDAAALVAGYLKHCCEFANRRVWEDPALAPGNEHASLKSVTLLDAAGELLELADLAAPVIVEVEYLVHRPGAVLNLSLSLYSQDDVYVLASPSTSDPNWYLKGHPTGTFRSRCQIPGSLLNEGRFSLSVLLVQDGVQVIGLAERVVSFDMVDSGAGRGNFFGTWGGVVRPPLQWHTQVAAGVGGEQPAP